MEHSDHKHRHPDVRDRGTCVIAEITIAKAVRLMVAGTLDAHWNSVSRVARSSMAWRKEIMLFINYTFFVTCHHCTLSDEIIEVSCIFKKPLILCSTGWSYKDFADSLLIASKIIPVIIVPNTSFGIYFL